MDVLTTSIELVHTQVIMLPTNTLVSSYVHSFTLLREIEHDDTHVSTKKPSSFVLHLSSTRLRSDHPSSCFSSIRPLQMVYPPHCNRTEATPKRRITAPEITPMYQQGHPLADFEPASRNNQAPQQTKPEFRPTFDTASRYRCFMSVKPLQKKRQ